MAVIEYLETPPSRDTLQRLFARAGIGAQDALRRAEPGAKALADAPEARVLDAMVADPILIERPIVETDKGVVLARPPERVRTIL